MNGQVGRFATGNKRYGARDRMTSGNSYIFPYIHTYIHTYIHAKAYMRAYITYRH